MSLAFVAALALAVAADETKTAVGPGLAARLEDPAAREAAFCEILKRARYHKKPAYTEDADCSINHVVVAPQLEGPPIYVVVRLDPEVYPQARLGRPRGPFTLVDGEGFIIPARANVLGPLDRFFQYAGDSRLALGQVVPNGDSGWCAQVLEVVPITPEQRAVLRVVVGPPLVDLCSGRFSWTWRPQTKGGAPVVQIGPRGADNGISRVVAEYGYSVQENRYLGPVGGVNEAFLRLDPDRQDGDWGRLKAFVEAHLTATQTPAPHGVPEGAPLDFAVPCSPGTAPYQEAEQSLTSLGNEILRLDAAPDRLAVINRALSALLGHPCFAMSDENPRSVIAPTALSLRTWWQDGGEAWLRSYLKLARPPAPGKARYVVLPPDMRPELSLMTAQVEQRTPLLCPPFDASCGQETKGWQSRAARAFGTFHLITPFKARKKDRTAEECRESAGSGPGSYARWRTCVETVGRADPALPLGGFRAPRHGWLLVLGRRGHYEFCDEIRAYDLETGAAFVAQSCAGLVLKVGGAVDHAATDKARDVRAFTGNVIADNLREAAWMTVLADEVRPARLEAEYQRLPHDMAPAWPRISEVEESIGGVSFGMNTSQTSLAWRWIDAGRILASGRVTWPNSADPGEDHAVTLLQVAEAALVEGPVATSLPDWVLTGLEHPGVSWRDATEEGLAAADRVLLESLKRLGRAGGQP